MSDCLEKGWILDGFPQTEQQAEELTKEGIVPSIVFSTHLDIFDIKARMVEKAKQTAVQNNEKYAQEAAKFFVKGEDDDGDDENKKKKDPGVLDLADYTRSNCYNHIIYQ